MHIITNIRFRCQYNCLKHHVPSCYSLVILSVLLCIQISRLELNTCARCITSYLPVIMNGIARESYIKICVSLLVFKLHNYGVPFSLKGMFNSG